MLYKQTKDCLSKDCRIRLYVLFVNKKLNPSNVYFSTAMLQRLSGKLSVRGLVNVKLTFKHLQ